MNGLEFIYNMFAVISCDILCGFGFYICWKYFDLKYFSSSEIEQLKAENKYLKEENKKVSGTSADFYGKDFDKL